MKTMKKVNIYILALMMSMITFSCINDTIDVDDIADEANREYTFDIPGGTIRSTIKDALSEFEIDTLISVDENGLLYINHKTDFEIDWPMVLTLDDQTGVFSYNLLTMPVVSNLKGTTEQIIISNTEKISINDQDGVRLDSVFITSAEMALGLNVPANMIESITIEMPQVFINEEPFVTEFISPSIPQDYFVDLSGAIMRFKHDEGSTEAYIELTTTIILKDNPIYAGSTSADISYGITNINPGMAFGYFGDRVIDSRTVDIDFDLFTSDKLGTTINFDDLIVDIQAYNSYGSPFQIAISDILFTDTETEVSKSIVLENGADVTHINPATINNLEIDTVLTEFKIGRAHV